MSPAEQLPFETSSNREETLRLLSDAAVDIFSWDVTRGTKSPNHLIGEVLAGESEIELVDGRLERRTRAIAVNISYKQQDRWLRLVEAYPDNDVGHQRIRRYSPSLPAELVDNTATGEDALLGVLEDKLGVGREGVAMWEHIRDEERRRESDSYPGLHTNELHHSYWVELNQSGYHPEGYPGTTADNIPRLIWVFDE
jgi:hypothetical protein